MITIACVLKSGGDFTEDHVVHLRDSILKHYKHKHEFICLTDIDLQIQGVESRPLSENLPGWWSKIELFKPGNGWATDRVFFLDLDTVILVDITHIIDYETPLIVLDNFDLKGDLATGMMSWRVKDQRHIWQYYEENKERVKGHIEDIEDMEVGQQVFIKAVPQVWFYPDCMRNYEFFQDVFPYEIVSFKRHCLDKSKLRSMSCKVPWGARIVCFHGEPRPWDERIKWMGT